MSCARLLVLLAITMATMTPRCLAGAAFAASPAEHLHQQLMDALIAMDADRLMSHYWNDPELMTVGEGGQVIKGWQENKDFWVRFFASAESVSFPVSNCHYWTTQDSIFTACASTIRVRLRGGREFENKGWYTNFRRLIGGSWLIVFEHVSTDARPPGVAP